MDNGLTGKEARAQQTHGLGEVSMWCQGSQREGSALLPVDGQPVSTAQPPWLGHLPGDEPHLELQCERALMPHPGRCLGNPQAATLWGKRDRWDRLGWPYPSTAVGGLGYGGHNTRIKA